MTYYKISIEALFAITIGNTANGNNDCQNRLYYVRLWFTNREVDNEIDEEFS